MFRFMWKTPLRSDVVRSVVTRTSSPGTPVGPGSPLTPSFPFGLDEYQEVTKNGKEIVK